MTAPPCEPQRRITRFQLQRSFDIQPSVRAMVAVHKDLEGKARYLGGNVIMVGSKQQERGVHAASDVRTQTALEFLQWLSYTRAVKRHKCRAPFGMESPQSTHRMLPRNLGLLELIRAKRERDWKPSVEELKKGFRGWHQRGYLPHLDAPGVTQFITFQLHDSFPVERRAEYEAILKVPDDSAKRRKLEAWLDRGHGECWLRRHDMAELVEKILLAEDGCDYRMQAWVVMPNHLHLVVDVWDVPLVELINGWKGKSSREANRLLGRRGPFWQVDYYDTLVRDEVHLKRAIRYTEQNPVKAYLMKTARDWPWSSVRHRDEYERLPWQHE